MPFQPVEWKKGAKQRFRDWIHNELENTLGDRHRLEEKWRDLIVQHRARVQGTGISDVPFVGASDLEYPITAIHYEPVYADLMQTLHVPRNFWSITPLRSDAVDSAKPLQEFFGVVERNEIKMRAVNEKAFIDMILLGTCIYKDTIQHFARTRRDYDENGEIAKITRITFQPEVGPIPLKDFILPAYAWEIDPDAIGGAPWVAQRFELTPSQLKARAKGQAPFTPNYDPEEVERALKTVTDQADREDVVKSAQREEDEYQPWREHKVRLYEIWARFDTSGDDGIADDIRIIYEHKSGAILQAVHNPLLHGRRPFSKAVYMPAPGFYGVGLGEADEWSQIALSRLMNSAIDNTLLANARMYGIPQGAMVSPEEAIYGGKIWPLGPNEKIQSIQLGEVYPSMFNLLEGLRQWSENRTGVSETRTGNISDLPSRTPASTVQSLLIEGNKKFDMILANLRAGPLAEIGQRSLQNIIQITRDDPKYIALAEQVLGPQDAALVAEILNGPLHDIEDKYGVTITATSSQVNKEAEKQNLVSLMQIAAQVYPALMQYATGLAEATKDPALLLATMQAGHTGQTELFARLLESFDIQNPERYLPLPQAAQGAPQAPGAPGVQAAPLGGPGGPGPLAQGAGALAGVLGI